MGYTHHWSNEKTIPVETWDKIITDCKYLASKLSEYDVHINGCFRYKNAQFSKSHIWFNGGDGGKRKKVKDSWEDVNENDLDHETFVLPRKPSSEFCKTARKPYDLMVCACLIIVKHYYPEINIRNGGDLGDTEWQDAFKFVEQYLPGVQQKFYTVLVAKQLTYNTGS